MSSLPFKILGQTAPTLAPVFISHCVTGKCTQFKCSNQWNADRREERD